MSTKIVKKKVMPATSIKKVTPMAKKTMIKKSPPKKIAKTPQNLELIDVNKNNKQRRTMVNKLQAKKKKTTEL